MLKSMTGYGNAVLELPEMMVRVEIKSLNSRNLDLSIRVPKVHSEKEITLRARISQLLQRGKISLTVDTEYLNGKSARKTLNKELMLAYYEDLKDIAIRTGNPTENLIPALLNVSDIVQPSIQDDVAEEEWKRIEKALDEALKKFESFRLQEGTALGEEMITYVNNIETYLQRVEKVKDSRLERVKTELRDKLAGLNLEGKMDENRFEQELIYYAEKLDITEEIVRLRTHLAYFLETMKEEAPGKKLGFISQEIGREINTIGAKANDANIQKDIVLMKEELEKIKEQVQNIL